MQPLDWVPCNQVSHEHDSPFVTIPHLWGTTQDVYYELFGQRPSCNCLVMLFTNHQDLIDVIITLQLNNASICCFLMFWE